VVKIGTDIYLEWDNIKKKEKEAQITGYDIGEGNKGYLRASIGMVTENTFLRGLFPTEYWEGKKKRYKFTEENYKKLIRAGLFYMFSSLLGKEIKIPETEFDKERGKNFIKMLSETFGDVDKMVFSENLDFRYAIMWINSVFSFYELGLRKEKEKLNPKIRISY